LAFFVIYLQQSKLKHRRNIAKLSPIKNPAIAGQVKKGVITTSQQVF